MSKILPGFLKTFLGYILKEMYGALLPRRPLISICILTWNRSKFLEMCIDNLLEALIYFENSEILIMDNGSTDQTEKVLEKYKQNKQIRIIRNKKHIGIRAYKKLFGKAKGDYIIDLDDDVLEFPLYFDRTMIEYMNLYSDYGFLALNVIQNEYTNGAKPDASNYMDDIRHGKTVLKGPAGGWCTCFRRDDYMKIRNIFNLTPLSFKKGGEDNILAGLFKKYLKLNVGIIKDQVCFHACGAHYARQYGHLEREIAKYESGNLTAFVDHYKSFIKK